MKTSLEGWAGTLGPQLCDSGEPLTLCGFQSAVQREGSLML